MNKATSIYAMSESGDEYLYTIGSEMDTNSIANYLIEILGDEAPYISKIIVSSTGYKNCINVSIILDIFSDLLD